MVQAQHEEPYFATIGEGYTAAQASEGISIGWRAFSTPDVPTVCGSPSAESTARLIASQQRIEVVVGEPFSFGDVNVMAVEAAGVPLGPVPITLEIEETPPQIVDLERYKVTGRDVRALRPGTFRIRVRPFCGGTGGPELAVIIHYVAKAK